MTMEPEYLQYLFTSGQLCRPVVLDNMISTWPICGWTPSNLAYALGDKTIKFRIGKKLCGDVQWETQCVYEHATIEQFLEWLQGATNADNPLQDYCRDDYWCYGDYKYMIYLFADQPEFLKAVDWSVFGFAGRDGSQSTLWIGSKGAYTPCHYDSYGCNLVAQIYGRKRWFLFPPEQLSCMYPTRVPYEESSVFSQVNVTNPELKKHPKFKQATPYVVTLEPGQALYVPRQWWHYVESLDTSLSINTWIELPSDKETRLQEAVTRTLVTTLMAEDTQCPLDTWLNPTEEPYPYEMNMRCIGQSLGMLDVQSHCDQDNSSSGDSHMESENEDTKENSKGIDHVSQVGDSTPAALDEEYQPRAKVTKFEMCADKNKSVIPGVSNSCAAFYNMENVSKVQCYSFHDFMDKFSKKAIDSDSDDVSIHVASAGDQSIVTKQNKQGECSVSQEKIGLTSCAAKESELECLVSEPSEPPSSAPCQIETHTVETGVEQTRVKEVKIDTATLLNCVVHPEIMSQICQLLKDNTKI